MWKRGNGVGQKSKIKLSLFLCLIGLLVNSSVFAYETNPDALTKMHKSFASQYSYKKNIESKSFDCYDIAYTCDIKYRGDGMQYSCPAIYIDGHAIMYDSYDFSKPRTRIIINGNENEYTYQNYLYNSRTLVPADIFRQLGCEVTFNKNTYVCTISGNNTVLEIMPNLIGMRKNMDKGYYVPIDVCARFINGALYVPVRAVADQLGLYVGWSDETKTVTLDSAKPEGQDALKPVLYINRLPETVNCSLFELSGSVWDKENVAEVYVNNELVVTSKVNEEKDWNKEFVLQPGENSFEIKFKNDKGYEFSEIRTVNYSNIIAEGMTTAPVFASLECPENVYGPSVTVKGYIANLNHGAKMSINGHSIELVGVPNNMFNIDLNGLKPGENTYKFIIANNHGQSTEVVKTITYIQK